MSFLDFQPVEISPVPPALDCWYLSGPTAAGKTKVGLELARRINAEIISLDSMTIYQEMNIGTAKPTAEERAAVPHHLLDVVPPTEEFSLSEYIDAAHEKIAEIRGRGREVLFVGGTPLYLKSLLRGVYQGPPADWDFRRRIDDELQTVGLAALHKRLEIIDPLSAAKLHPNDKRRIVRALEVYKQTGVPLSHLQTQFDEGHRADQVRVFVLAWPREDLHRRIEARVDAMFAAGLVDEVRALLAKHRTLSRTASQAVGYREVMDMLEAVNRQAINLQASEERAAPDDLLNECIEKVKARTRRFARRQETWFRSLSECTLVPQRDGMSAAAVADGILRSAHRE